jgi:hypothetical protein
MMLLAALLLAFAPAAAAEVPTGNLVVNGGAEDGAAAVGDADVAPPDSPWNASAGFTQHTYGGDFISTSVAQRIGGGNAFFAGGPGAASSNATQSITGLDAIPEVAAGAVTARLSACLGGYLGQGDAMTITAVFKSGDDVLATSTIGPGTAAQRGSRTDLVPAAATRTVPATTDQVVVTLTANRTEGIYNDGYADNVALELNPTARNSCTPPPPPPPPIAPPPGPATMTATANPTCTGVRVRFQGPAALGGEFDFRVPHGPETDGSLFKNSPPVTETDAFGRTTNGPIRPATFGYDGERPVVTAYWTFGWVAQQVKPGGPVRFVRPDVDVYFDNHALGPSPLGPGSRSIFSTRVRFLQRTPDESRGACPPGALSFPSQRATLTGSLLKGGNLVTTVKCGGTSACVGSLSATTVAGVLRANPAARKRRTLVARGPFTVPPKSKKRVRLRVTKKARKLLRKRRRLRIQVATTTIAPNGKLRTRRRQVTVRVRRR